MFKKLLGRKEGFTLIEVVIVMAIAGLIFVIVFLAVQGAQRGRRDNERRSAGARMIAAAEQYSSNNNGAVPANCAAFATYYNNQSGSYPCTDVGTSPSAAATGNVEFGPNRECAADNTFATKNRVVAARFWSEAGNAVLCQDSD